ncbi:DUF2993 domain-containing protein [Nocardia sp. NBC_01503]|uniref:LmeA family phospholipid-binding protein n=1 Tax=Nocardia sp. NBC_01503 TaxID=2975997 RepID=UPI002E7B845E|nr:DUF2993 domain-containing protein [Nocardia sp. NBC_01503]WTL29973.1 DUF2993 domain-containing protein [Nocardia sp. NBC_01503]
MRALLILVIVLLIALVVGDRVAVVMAQHEIGRKIAADYGLPNQPSVTIGGVPFLTQAVDGTYRDIEVRVGEWTEKNLSVHDLDVKLTDVSAPLGDILNNRTSNLVAATAKATAVVPYDAVRPFAPEGVESISYSPEGLRVTGTFSVQGISVPATVTVTVAPTADGIEVTPVSVQPASGGPTIPLALLSSTLAFTVPLERLPLGAQLTAIQPGADGLHVSAVAANVRFSDLP